MDESLKRQIHEECWIRNRSEGTCRQYTYHIGGFLDWIGDKPLNELTPSDARNYIIKKRNDGVKPESCNSINAALVFYYRYILHISWDPNIVPRMKRDWTLPQVISRDDIEKLIDTATNIRNKAIIALTYSAGLRVGEVCKLAPTDIYTSSMQIHVRNSKNHGDHWTILSERALESISFLLK